MTRQTKKYQKLGQLRSGIGKTLSESNIKDIHHQADMDKLNQSIARGQKAIGKLALGSQIYDSAKTTGKKIDEAAEWAADTEGIDAVYEPGVGGVEKITGYKIEGTDKIYGWEEVSARKEQAETDYLANIESGGGIKSPGDITSEQAKDQTTLIGMAKATGYGEGMGEGKTFSDWSNKMATTYGYSQDEFNPSGKQTDYTRMLSAILTGTPGENQGGFSPVHNVSEGTDEFNEYFGDM